MTDHVGAEGESFADAASARARVAEVVAGVGDETLRALSAAFAKRRGPAELAGLEDELAVAQQVPYHVRPGEALS